MASKNYVSNDEKTVRMFESDFMEALSKVHWTVPLILYVPVIFYFLYKTGSAGSMGVLEATLYFLSGIVVWTFTEYALHRFIFHFEPRGDLGRKLHFIFHGVHHDYPRDPKRLVMPPSVSLPLAALFYFLFVYLIGRVLIFPFFAGFLTGYLGYDMTHYAVHHYKSKNRLFLAIKKHHMRHHYKEAGKDFGVSQPAWDYVFRTKNDEHGFME